MDNFTDVGLEDSKKFFRPLKVLIKTPRRSLHPLQKSAVDKENLVGAGRSTNYMTPNKGKLNVVTEIKSAKKLKVSKGTESKSITVEDLTSEEEPGKEYYKVLAERRRVALEEALKENEQLHEKVRHLEEENEQCNILLNETRQLVETLTEMLKEGNDEEDSEEEGEGGSNPQDDVKEA
ncbi:geminin DNA replication inhibitor isoform X2 [Rhodnius prolixus]|uniref:geminin DNA replication inhibitor isoform X2 n=1 Tax=Rhodnius prolixus TaxID=13249 RepID=UPI003D18C2ED